MTKGEKTFTNFLTRQSFAEALVNESTVPSIPKGKVEHARFQEDKKPGREPYTDPWKKISLSISLTILDKIEQICIAEAKKGNRLCNRRQVVEQSVENLFETYISQGLIKRNENQGRGN